MPYHYTDALTNDLYPMEANVDMHRSELNILDLAACWPDLPRALENKPKEVYDILARDSELREKISYAEIEQNINDATWWCNNIFSIINILQSIPSKDKQNASRSFETRFIDFLNAWKLERFIIDTCKATANGGGEADGSLHKGAGEAKPDLFLNGKLTEVKLIRDYNNSSSAIKYYAGEGYASLYGASQLLLYRSAAEGIILVKNIIDVHKGADAKISVLDLKNIAKPVLYSLPILVPKTLLKYLNNKTTI